MAPTIPTAEPASVNAGDTIQWTRTLPDYPADDGWTLAYELVNAAGRITFSASASGGDHAVSVSAATSGEWTAGDYTWRARVSKSAEVFTVGTGRITVVSAWGVATDARSQARRQLEAVEALIEGRAARDVQEYQIAGRTLKHLSIPDLLTLRDRLRADVAREDAAAAVAAGGFDPRRLYVRFGPRT